MAATEDQLAFEWSRICGRIEGHTMARGRGVLTLVVGLAALIVVVGAEYWVKRSDSARFTAEITEAEGPTTTTLVDDSRIVVAPGGKIRLVERSADSVRVVVERGEADFDVTHRPGRTFVVGAAGIDIRVVGTHFTVAVQGDAARPGSPGGQRVRVSVARGAVDVVRPPQQVAVRIGTGEQQLFGDADEARTDTAASPTESPSAGRSTEANLRTPVDAQRLFEQANLARRAGRAGEAAHLYGVFVARFPNNKRAGLAALELGRLRMDSLGDLSGATEVLRRAVKTLPSGSLHEDAQARLVDALDGLRDWSACRRARAEYLKRYRHGVHAIAVDARCVAR